MIKYLNKQQIHPFKLNTVLFLMSIFYHSHIFDGPWMPLVFPSTPGRPSIQRRHRGTLIKKGGGAVSGWRVVKLLRFSKLYSLWATHHFALFRFYFVDQTPQWALTVVTKPPPTKSEWLTRGFTPLIPLWNKRVQLLRLMLRVNRIVIQPVWRWESRKTNTQARDGMSRSAELSSFHFHWFSEINGFIDYRPTC